MGSLLYSSSMVVFYLIKVLGVALSPLGALVDGVLPLLFVPLIPIFLLAGACHSRPAYVATGLIFAVFLSYYGSRFIRVRRPVERARHSLTFTAMTFNLRYQYYRPDDLLDTIYRENADIVALQELAPETARQMHARLSDRYPYRIPSSAATRSVGLLSRFPIRTFNWFRPADQGRYALQATLDVHGQPLHVFVVHAYPPGIRWLRQTMVPTGLDYGIREAEMEDLVARATRLRGPVLILGDFNMNEYTRPYRVLSRRFTDAYHQAGQGFGFTFPQDVIVGDIRIPGPFARIDFIFTSSALTVLSAEVECNGASDHCYVTSQLGVPDPVADPVPDISFE